MLVPIEVNILFAKEPPDVEHQTLLGHVKWPIAHDGRYFNAIYIIIFGGFLGFATFLPRFSRHSFAATDRWSA